MALKREKTYYVRAEQPFGTPVLTGEVQITFKGAYDASASWRSGKCVPSSFKVHTLLCEGARGIVGKGSGDLVDVADLYRSHVVDGCELNFPVKNFGSNLAEVITFAEHQRLKSCKEETMAILSISIALSIENPGDSLMP